MLRWSFCLQNKTEIRKKLLTICQKIDAESKQKAALAALQIFMLSDLFLKANHCGCYFPLKNEFDCTPILNALLIKHCYLPILNNQKLAFVPYQSGDTLKLNHYKVLEPTATHPVVLSKLDLVIVPLVAVDRHGIRLGRGAGYYDKTFDFRLNNAYQKPFLLGLGFSLQQVDQLPRDVWDVQLDGLLTENSLTYFNHRI